MEYRSLDWYSLDEHARECEEFVRDICPVHGTERTAQRGGDPQCTDCYVESLASMPDAPLAATMPYRFEIEREHGRLIITLDKDGTIR